jgi:tetratricopeptide (TPR) repeat protein
MMDAILDRLQKISDLHVKSRSSVEKYRHEDRDIEKIGNELNVSFLVEASVNKSGNDLRITAELVNAKNGDRLWSEIYDEKYTDKIFEFQSKIAKKIASSLNAVITPKEENRIDRKPTENLEAYDLSLKGWQMFEEWHKTRDRTYLEAAHHRFIEALKYDPTYRKAISGKVGYFWRSGQYDSALSVIDKEIALYPREAEGYQGKGACWMALWRPDSALIYLSIAEKIKPNDIWLNIEMGQAYWGKNEYNKALHYLQKAYELTANDPLPDIGFFIGRVFLDIGEYSRARKYFQESLNIEPSWCFHIYFPNMTYLAQGKFNQATQFLDSICYLSPCTSYCNRERFHINFSTREYNEAELYYNEEIDETVIRTPLSPFTLSAFPFMDKISIAWIYFETGRKEEAMKILENTIHEDKELLKEDPSWPNINLLRLAATYAIKGENEISLKYLTELERVGFYDGWQDYIEYYPPFEHLKADPEFKAIVRKSQEKKAIARAQFREMEDRGELNL